MSVMSRQEALDVLKQHQIRYDAHVVLSGGLHSGVYIDNRPLKNRLKATYLLTRKLLSLTLRTRCFNVSKPVVAIGPETMGKVLAEDMRHPASNFSIQLIPLPIEKGLNRSFKRLGNVAELLRPGAQIFWVDDTLSSGSTFEKTKGLVSEHGGNISAVAVLTNRNQVSASTLGVNHLVAIQTVDAPHYEEGLCPFCRRGDPIKLSVGHGREFQKHNPDYPGGFVE